jgi:hypothetical protein
MVPSSRITCPWPLRSACPDLRPLRTTPRGGLCSRDSAGHRTPGRLAWLRGAVYRKVVRPVKSARTSVRPLEEALREWYAVQSLPLRRPSRDLPPGPPEAPSYPILRRMSSTSHRRAAREIAHSPEPGTANGGLDHRIGHFWPLRMTAESSPSLSASA